MTQSARTALTAACLLAATLLAPPLVQARPQFAQATGNPCSVCHVSPLGGGPLTIKGEAFRATLSDLGTPMDPSLRVSQGRRLLHVLLYFMHIVFGAGLVGLFLATYWQAVAGAAPPGPLPRAYVRPFIICMAVIALAGPFLFTYKLRTVPGLLLTRFGALLAVKACAALVLILAAASLLWRGTVVLGRRYRTLLARRESGTSLDLTREDLALFSGREGHRAFISFEGVVYDVTGRDLWRAGRHPGGHAAGKDLSAMLSDAPHGQDVFGKVPRAGRLASGPGAPRRTGASWLATLGVAACVVIVAVVALWRL